LEHKRPVLVGDLIAGKYRIERLLGQGGMGAVYLAHHEILQRLVAIKFLRPELAQDPDSVSRFVTEARAAARIQSEHAVAVLDSDQHEGRAFMVLEYLEGQDLQKLIEARRRLSVNETLRLVLEALEAIAQAHALGIIHRDLKPANLFLASRSDGSSIVKVLDFGLSKLSYAPMTETTSGMGLGTPSYMAPEQFRNAKRADGRADLWATGVILYQFLTGQLPFPGADYWELERQVNERTPVAPSSLLPGLPALFDRVTARCLEKNLDRRYANAQQLAEGLWPLASKVGRDSIERIRRTVSGRALPPFTGESVARGGTPHMRPTVPWTKEDSEAAKLAMARDLRLASRQPDDDGAAFADTALRPPQVAPVADTRRDQPDDTVQTELGRPVFDDTMETKRRRPDPANKKSK
jgi:serine/threonine-protein kinase